jgi:hypothetical protein
MIPGKLFTATGEIEIKLRPPEGDLDRRQVASHYHVWGQIHRVQALPVFLKPAALFVPIAKRFARVPDNLSQTEVPGHNAGLEFLQGRQALPSPSH